MRLIRIVPLVLCAALWAACGSGGEEGATAGGGAPPAEAPAPAAQPEPAAGGDVSAVAMQEAEQIFATRCFTCHGQLGKGDGPGSAGLTPKPRDLTSPEWQAKVTDEHIEQIIRYGGAAVGLSPMMPPNPDLVAKPEVVTALRLHVRSLKAH